MFKCRRPHTYSSTDKQCKDTIFAKFQMIHRHHHQEFHKYHQYFRYFRPAIVLFHILTLYLLFSWVGFKGIGIFFAFLISIKEIFQFVFLLRLEKRILAPIEKLKVGVDEIAKGNYNVKVDYSAPNDLGLLIFSFNEMAQKLYETEKMQTGYEEDRKALIANISHDLKTPITAIQGYIEVLQDGTIVDEDDKSKYLRTIHHNTTYINKLIDDLFLFSKLDMQKLDFSFETIQICAFMNDFMEEYKFDLEEKNTHFQYITQLEHDYLVKLDGRRFHQAFNNIISNAVKHGPESNLAIKIKMYQHDNFICIDIQDNGPGIASDKLPYIFNRFYRIDTERKKNYGCTGLGLAIALELIEAHGGKITVSSIESAGTCFTIILPILQNNGD
ncbi:sensor histidine kinase [Sporomusa malonica]|uniref:histidine kinase n=1 Tax=Sporomusa malonica TaxID=112901 RepID=A0A1W2DZ48_9FIRM|nr:HAMP domain-containing sensor histidine kinase [Sporomusa malonica]SMD02607.1 Signal transduction histidine kinase [Sporomusa malonica]